MASPSSSAKSVLKTLIVEEIAQNQSKTGWRGTGVKIKRYTYAADSTQRAEIQQIGKKFGCHTCLTTLHADFDQPWIGDHILPTNLSRRSRVALLKKFSPPDSTSPLRLDAEKETVLFPQCDQCAKEQSALVKKLNGSTRIKDQVAALTKHEQKLLLGGVSAVLYGTCIQSSGDKVSASEGVRIQKLGETNGCHSCDISDPKIPAKIYIADHTFPQEFCTPYMEKVFESLDLSDEYPDSFELRPQCPRCSGDQGGKMRNIAALAQTYATQAGITHYK